MAYITLDKKVNIVKRYRCNDCITLQSSGWGCWLGDLRDAVHLIIVHAWSLLFSNFDFVPFFLRSPFG